MEKMVHRLKIKALCKVAGIIMREYGRIDDTIYQEGINSFYYDDLKSMFTKKEE